MGTINFPPPLPPAIWLLVILTPLLSAECPYYCDCKWKNGKEAIICTNANISSVPARLDFGTQVLDLSKTAIDALRNDTFATLGLVNLQKLYITSSRVSRIERFAFRKLVNLVDLDLSNNLLESIPSHAFHEVVELRELKLRFNLIRRIANNAFINVPNLVRLELSDCRISNIEPNAFLNLEATLEWLRIDGNLLQTFRYTAIKSLENLHGFELARNPWNCSCSIKGLFEWIIESNLPFGDPPTCSTPPRLKGRSWNNLKRDDFGCVPFVRAKVTTAEGVEGRNVTITCEVSGTPVPTTRWIFQNNITRREIVTSARMMSRVGANATVSLTIAKVDFHDAGNYVCIGENNVGQAEAGTRLIVTKQPSGSMKTATMVGVIVLALILVFITWLMAIYLLLSKEKKRLRLWKMKRTKALYHKIEMDKNGGAGNATSTEQHGFTTEDEDKYDAITATSGQRKYREGDSEAYEMSAKLLTTKYRQQEEAGKKESGFSIRSPQKFRGARMEPAPDLFREQSSDLMLLRGESDYENIPVRSRLNVQATVSSSGGYYEPYDRNCNDVSLEESRFGTLPKRVGPILEQRRKLSADFSSNYSLSSILNANTRTGSVISINNNSTSLKQSNSSLPTSPILSIKTSISSIAPLLSYRQQPQQPYVMSPPSKVAPPSTSLTYASTSSARERENNYLQNGCSSLLRDQIAGGGYVEAPVGIFENYTDIPMQEYQHKNNNNGNLSTLRMNRNLLLKRLGGTNKFY